MFIMAKEPEVTFTNAPEGVHVARCYRVIALGTQPNPMGDPRPKIMISWELPNALQDTGEPYVISEFYTLSLYEKANLRKHLEAWRGRAFTVEELAGFEVGNILGVPCQLQILHETKTEGKTYANIKSLMAVPAGLHVPELSNELIYFSLHPDHFSLETFKKLSEGLQAKIQQSPEWVTANHPTYQQAPINSVDAAAEEPEVVLF